METEYSFPNRLQTVVHNKCIGDDTKAATRRSPNCIRKTKKKIKYGEERFSIWRMEFLHSTMWHVALDDMPLNSPKRPLYWNSTPGFDFRHITSVDMSWHDMRNFIQVGPATAKKITSCRFWRWRISAILDFRGPIMGSLRIPCTTSCRSSIDTIALNCLVFEKIAFFAFWRLTD